MPRNGAGAYTLPAGNPVVAGTTITDSWGNTTMSDVASELTNSLDRSGRGAMLAALQAYDGAVGAPGLTFASETSMGLYRIGAAQFGASVSATLVTQWSAAQFSTVLGSVTAPSHSFIGDLNTGMWSPAADTLAWSVNGTEVLRAPSTGDRVGIGNTQPSVVGLGVGNTARTGENYIRSFTSTNDLYFGQSSGTIFGLTAGNVGGVWQNGAKPLGIGTLSNQDIIFGTNGLERVRVDASGNVGIGRTPTALLDVAAANDARIVLDGTSGSANAGGTALFYRTGVFLGSIGVSANRLGDSSISLLIHAINAMDFRVGAGTGTKWLTLTSDGRLAGTALHNNAGSVSGTTSQFIASGTYNPTLTNVLAASSLTGTGWSWIRVGNVVTVAGAVTCAGSASTLVEFTATIPIASTQTSGTGGTINHNHAGTSDQDLHGNVSAAASNTVDVAYLNKTLTSQQGFNILFQYLIT